jgi:hypothetical protein
MNVDKSTGEMTFVGGIKWYVRHLDKSFNTKQLFKPRDISQEVLEKMEPIVNGYFRFKSLKKLKMLRKFNDVMDEDDEDGFGDADAEDIFG